MSKPTFYKGANRPVVLRLRDNKICRVAARWTYKNGAGDTLQRISVKVPGAPGFETCEPSDVADWDNPRFAIGDHVLDKFDRLCVVLAVGARGDNATMKAAPVDPGDSAGASGLARSFRPEDPVSWKDKP